MSRRPTNRPRPEATLGGGGDHAGDARRRHLERENLSVQPVGGGASPVRISLRPLRPAGALHASGNAGRAQAIFAAQVCDTCTGRLTSRDWPDDPRPDTTPAEPTTDGSTPST